MVAVVMVVMTEPLTTPLEALTPVLHPLAPPFPLPATEMMAPPFHPEPAPLPALAPALRPLPATLQVPAPAPTGMVVSQALPLLSFDARLSERIARIGLGREPGRAGEQRGRRAGINERSRDRHSPVL